MDMRSNMNREGMEWDGDNTYIPIRTHRAGSGKYLCTIKYQQKLTWEFLFYVKVPEYTKKGWQHNFQTNNPAKVQKRKLILLLYYWYNTTDLGFARETPPKIVTFLPIRPQASDFKNLKGLINIDKLK